MKLRPQLKTSTETHRYLSSGFDSSLACFKKRMSAAFFSTFVLFFLGCGVNQTKANSPVEAEFSPAVMINADGDAIAELNTHIRSVIGQQNLDVGSLAFKKSNIVALSKKDLTGRVIAIPERFSLSTDGQACYLEHVSTSKRWTLEHVECKVREKAKKKSRY